MSEDASPIVNCPRCGNQLGVRRDGEVVSKHKHRVVAGSPLTITCEGCGEASTHEAAR